MQIDIYQIDAFTDHLFGGNPAAVCPLDRWLDDEIMKKIAAENNLAETAFFTSEPNGSFQLRWFTPEIEMDLCGHATLATAYVIFNEWKHPKNVISFSTKSGMLTVRKKDENYLELDFPSRPAKRAHLPDTINKALNIPPSEVFQARDFLLIYNSEAEVAALRPDEAILNQINLDPGGIIVSARADRSDLDFVSRFFTPQATLFEDPVTGSAHCTLIPYWTKRLNKTNVRARQISKRGGQLNGSMVGDRVRIRGRAVKYLQGSISL